MMRSYSHRRRLKPTAVIIVLVTLFVCCSTSTTTPFELEQNQQREQRNTCWHAGSLAPPIALPTPSERSTQRVTQLLHPFSLQTFAGEFWEKKPLLVRGRSPDHGQQLLSFGVSDVDAVIEGVSLSGNEPYLVPGSDWNIIKRVFNPQDGEFWTAAFSPSSRTSTLKGKSPILREAATPASAANSKAGKNENGPISLDEARGAFQRGGFSLVINRLQRRWRGVADVALALEDVLGQPVNANMYMTPPGSQGFEAHFDWMDGLIMQLEGSKTWILYDELLPAPRADLKYKPSGAQLGEPIAVLELQPGDLMYIPRGYPHEAAVNGTGRAGGTQGVSLHVTFGIESSLWGSYESLVHHALEIAAAEHPELFSGVPAGNKDSEGEEVGVQREDTLPWLQLLHLCIHDVASRYAHLRKAVPLAPLFLPTPTSTPSSRGVDSAAEGEQCSVDTIVEGGSRNPTERRKQQVLPAVVASEAERALKAVEAGGDAVSTLRLLDSLLEAGQLERVPFMYPAGSGNLSPGVRGEEEEDNGSPEESLLMNAARWDRRTFERLDRPSFVTLLRTKLEIFSKLANTEAALGRMVSSVERKLADRAAATESDLARCSQLSTTVRTE